MQETSISIEFARKVLANAGAAGCDSESLLRRSRIAPSLLRQSQARVSAQQFAQLETLAMREMRDEMLGYCAQPLPLGHWSALSHWLLHCKTLGQALKRFRIFYDMLQRGLQISMTVEKAIFRLDFTPWPTETRALDPYAYEMFMFNFHRLFRILTESDLPIQSVGLCYPAPPYAVEYRHIFLAAPVVFDQPRSYLVFARDYLSTPITLSYENLAKFLRNPLYNLLVNSYNSKSWSRRVSEILGSDLQQLPRFEQVAAALEINPKKLSRLLAREGVKYGELKLELRRDQAIDLLSRQDTSVEEIAFRTGFSESSAFIRAFKKWTGVTPYTYRKGLKR